PKNRGCKTACRDGIYLSLIDRSCTPVYLVTGVIHNQPHAQMNKKQILTTTVVLAILGLLIYFQVQHWRRFDWARFRSVSHVDPFHIAAAIALIYLTYVLRALRWKVFLEPVRKASTWKMVPPTFIGFAGLALLGRPGE